MAQKRMFDKSIVRRDDFMEMPISTQNLYFHLSLDADDDGFVNNWKSILKITSCKEDDLKLLISKQFVIPFESGVIVIKHWRINNILRSDRYHETKYLAEKSLLNTGENQEYTLGTPLVYQLAPEYSIEENRIEEYSIEKNNKEKEVVEVVNEPKIYSYIESNLGITISGSNYDKIKLWLETFNDTMLCYAIDKTIAGGKRTLNYFFGILENWKQENFKTIEDVKSNEIKPKSKRQEVVYELV